LKVVKIERKGKTAQDNTFFIAADFQIANGQWTGGEMEPAKGDRASGVNRNRKKQIDRRNWKKEKGPNNVW